MRPGPARDLLVLVARAATYGFSLGAMHSWRLALIDVWKFPLLILGTSAVCALAYDVSARVIAPALPAGRIHGLVLRAFRDTSVLLASTTPPALFLSMVLPPPQSRADLAGYSTFLAFNMLLIATAGALSVVHNTKALLLDRLGLPRALAVLGVWLGLSLVVGGQFAFFLRPFFGIVAVDPHPPLFEGAQPDFRGAANFFEVVANLLTDLA